MSFLHYPYPVLFESRRFNVLTVADPRDIACMKLDACANREDRRDFVDLFVAAQAYGLRNIFEWFDAKYAAVAYNRTHLFKALTYFKDAEQQPLPDLLVPFEWSALRQFFTTEVPRLSRLFS